MVGLPTAGLPKARPVLRSSQGRVVYAPYTHLELKIIDDGCGMPASKSGVDPAQPSGYGHGLLNMRYRAELIGASIAWRNRRFGSGTVVELRVPLPPSPRSCG
ncbi:ATP-binding protein [Thermostichus sp. MS-CIW-28]